MTVCAASKTAARREERRLALLIEVPLLILTWASVFAAALLTCDADLGRAGDDWRNMQLDWRPPTVRGPRKVSKCDRAQ
jgi:hypothetical protein